MRWNNSLDVTIFDELENLRELHVGDITFPAGTRFTVHAVAVRGLKLTAWGKEFWLSDHKDNLDCSMPEHFRRAVTMPKSTHNPVATGWESSDGDPEIWRRLAEWAKKNGARLPGQ
ncbi:MAG: hypothetical protein NTX72_02900 [Candidatus Uhrbacteria bacterium]|nr:hypothetical protein [Candidatus Uhrbacteria bacterium]